MTGYYRDLGNAMRNLFECVCAEYRRMWDTAPRMESMIKPAMSGQEILLWLVDPETLELNLCHGIEAGGRFVWF